MCLCTQYDSPTCGHSWISMSQPCGFCSDLLNCPNRQTYQVLIAPPMTCPQCNGGFSDAETIQMIQGPWGCNQMVRNHWGGSMAIPGQWGNAPLVSRNWGSTPAIPGDWGGFDHRLTGPYTPGSSVGTSMIVHDGWSRSFGDGFMHGDWNGGRRRHRSSYYRKYHRSTRPATNCTVM